MPKQNGCRLLLQIGNLLVQSISGSTEKYCCPPIPDIGLVTYEVCPTCELNRKRTYTRNEKPRSQLNVRFSVLWMLCCTRSEFPHSAVPSVLAHGPMPSSLVFRDESSCCRVCRSIPLESRARERANTNVSLDQIETVIIVKRTPFAKPRHQVDLTSGRDRAV